MARLLRALVQNGSEGIDSAAKSSEGFWIAVVMDSYFQELKRKSRTDEVEEGHVFILREAVERETGETQLWFVNGMRTHTYANRPLLFTQQFA